MTYQLDQKISTPHLTDHIGRVRATIRAPLDFLHSHGSFSNLVQGLVNGAGVDTFGAVTLPL